MDENVNNVDNNDNVETTEIDEDVKTTNTSNDVGSKADEDVESSKQCENVGKNENDLDHTETETNKDVDETQTVKHIETGNSVDHSEDVNANDSKDGNINKTKESNDLDNIKPTTSTEVSKDLCDKSKEKDIGMNWIDSKSIKDENTETTENNTETTQEFESRTEIVKEKYGEAVKGITEESIEKAVGEAIEEPLMIVTGEGNGADCESSYFIGEEICEPVMYFCGEGWGADNDTGNPDAIQSNSNKSDEENPPGECNGEYHDLSNTTQKAKTSKSVKLKNKSIIKRSFKKQSNDSTDNLKSDCKKHCIRELDKSNGSNSNSFTESDTKRESNVNDKNATDCENLKKVGKKKIRSKVKKKQLLRKVKKDDKKEAINSVSESENCQSNKTSIIEKRKSSLSSDQSEDNGEEGEGKISDKEVKAENDLPPKKLRLETPEPETVSHSNEMGDNKDETVSNENNENDNSNTNVQNDTITGRKKIKARKGKLKAKKVLQKPLEEESKDDKVDDDKKESKGLKRSLLNANASDKNNESQSESEDEEPATLGKRLKIKPKKINTSTRYYFYYSISRMHLYLEEK